MLATVESILYAEHIDRMDKDMYMRLYEDREVAIDCWLLEELDEKDQDLTVITKTLEENHGFLRPGDFVRTYLGDDNTIIGQVIALPMEFPDGEYAIRCIVPMKAHNRKFEYAVVLRAPEEFILASGEKERSGRASDRILQAIDDLDLHVESEGGDCEWAS
jgi:hypothetical protein